jgi:hypothetical protein
MAFVSTGLPNNGRTAHFQIRYDTTLSSGPALARALLGACESDYRDMAAWFGLELHDLPLEVNIANQSGGASWSDGITGPRTVTIKPVDSDGHATLTQIRYLLVAEITEIFMSAQDRGWFAGGDEGSKGEGLSRFLGIQFLLMHQLADHTPDGFGVTALWLNSSRPNYIDNDPDDHAPDVITGCTTLFLCYLHDQLGYTINQIITAGADTLGGVYRNLTGRSDGWIGFRALVDAHYPPGEMYFPTAETVFPVPSLTTIDSPGTITTGYPGTGRLVLDRPALVDLTIQLISGDAALAAVRAAVTIPAGATTTGFTITTTALSGPFSPKTIELRAHYAGHTLATTLQIVAPQLAGMALTPTGVPAGAGATGTLTLARPSLNGDVVANLLSVAPGFATVPPTVTIPQGQLSRTFPVTTRRIDIPFPTAHADLQAEYAGRTADAQLTITSTVIAGILATLTLQPASITGGTTARGVVTLQHSVPTPTVVGLAATDTGADHPPLSGHDHSSIASTPPSITIPAGAFTGTFTIRTSTVARGTRHTVTIIAGAVTTKYAALTVTG